METSADSFLASIYSQELVAEKRALSTAAYEEKVIKLIMGKAGLGDNVKKLVLRAKEKTGKPRLLFEWFYDEYPSFPIYLGARKIPFAFKVTVKELFNKFTATPIYKAWEEFIEETAQRSPAGLVFDWPGVRGTKMLVHNDTLSLINTRLTTRMTFSVGLPSHPVMLVVEQFEPYLDAVLESWIPGSSSAELE